MLARTTLSDDVAYRLARAIHRSEGFMGTRLLQARETTMSNTVAVSPRLDLIQPGVLQYLRGIGLIPIKVENCYRAKNVD